MDFFFENVSATIFFYDQGDANTPFLYSKTAENAQTIKYDFWNQKVH